MESLWVWVNTTHYWCAGAMGAGAMEAGAMEARAMGEVRKEVIRMRVICMRLDAWFMCVEGPRAWQIYITWSGCLEPRQHIWDPARAWS